MGSDALKACWISKLEGGMGRVHFFGMHRLNDSNIQVLLSPKLRVYVNFLLT